MVTSMNRLRLDARGAVKWVALIWFLSSFVNLPGRRDAFEGLPHLELWPAVLSAPIVLTGDSPHYLIAVNSLIEDADLDLANNYNQARAGGLDMGVRFRGLEIDRHVETDLNGRQLGTHPPFMPLALKGRLFRLAVLYSLAWGATSGLFPALVYDQTPWGFLDWIYSRLTGAG